MMRWFYLLQFISMCNAFKSRPSLVFPTKSIRSKSYSQQLRNKLESWQEKHVTSCLVRYAAFEGGKSRIRGDEKGKSPENDMDMTNDQPIPEGQTTVWDSFDEIFVDQGRYFMKKAVPYYFLRDELGVSESKMLRISLDHGQVLNLSVERSLRPKVQWLRDTLGLTRLQAAQLVGSSPNVLLLSIEDNLAPKLQWLEDELNMKSKAEKKKFIQRCPQFLTASTASLLMKMAFFKDDVGISAEDIKKIVKTTPAILVLSLDTLVDKVEYLTEELGMNLSQDMKKLLIKAPSLFFNAIDGNLKSKLGFFRKELGLSNAEIRKIVLLNPRLLSYNVVKRGRAFLTYMIKTPLGFTREEVKKMVQRAPSLVALDVASPRFEQMIELLKKTLEVQDTAHLSHVIKRFPMVLSYTAEALRLRLGHLVELLELNALELRTLLDRYPQILGYRSERLQEKIKAIRDIYELPPSTSLKSVLLKAPALLSYSIESRLRPRLQQTHEAGLSLEQVASWLALSDSMFQDRVERQITEEDESLLKDLPLLRQRSNAKLRKLLRRPRNKNIQTIRDHKAN